MTVTKPPRTRKGTGSQGPPLSWPNDTVIGRRRPSLGLLRQATHNRQQRRLSTLPADSKQNVPRPVQHSAVRSQASRASGHPRYKTHTRPHHSTQQSTAPKFTGKPLKTKKGPAPPHSKQPWKRSKLSRSSLIDEKEDAKSQKDGHIISATKDIDWPAYHRAKSQRLKKIRIWVNALRRAHRILDPVAKELMAYYGSPKYGAHPAASTLSEHAWQVVKLCEHEFGTDLQWGKSLGVAVWGTEHEKVEKMIEMRMASEEREGVMLGRGTVGESDLSEFEDEDDGDGEGFWGEEGEDKGKGEEKDVEMADKA